MLNMSFINRFYFAQMELLQVGQDSGLSRKFHDSHRKEVSAMESSVCIESQSISTWNTCAPEEQLQCLSHYRVPLTCT